MHGYHARSRLSRVCIEFFILWRMLEYGYAFRRFTIPVFLYLKVAFYQVDLAVL